MIWPASLRRTSARVDASRVVAASYTLVAALALAGLAASVSAATGDAGAGGATAATHFDVMPIEELHDLLADPRRSTEQEALRQRFSVATDADKRIFFNVETDRQGRPMLAERGCLYTDLKARRRIRMLLAQDAETRQAARTREIEFDDYIRDTEQFAAPRLAQVAALLGDVSSGAAGSLPQAAKLLSRLEQDLIARDIAHQSRLGGDAQTWAATSIECRVSYLALDVVDQVFSADDLERVMGDDSEFANASFLLLQHLGRRPDVQRQYLPKVEQGVGAGLFPRDRYALLWDRVESSAGNPQRYGTQLVRGSNGCVGLSPADQPRALIMDAERRELGLEPLGVYMRELARAYGATLCPA